MKFVKYFFVFVFCCIFFGAIFIYCVYKYVEKSLPDVTMMKDIHLQVPLKIFSADNKLMAQYGEKHCVPVMLNEIPLLMVQAFIAIEDRRYYDHHGIDVIGIFRALIMLIISGYPSQGASTITQQLARNFYLSPEKTFLRKAKEVFLAIRIEQLFTKNEIIELYLNKIYLGNRAYGVGAAAYVYFGKTVDKLTLNEIAMIAGLPKAPSTFNPFYSYNRATNRRNIVLLRMFEEGYITKNQYNYAKKEKIKTFYHIAKIEVNAPYLSEMVRQTLYNKYGENAYIDGYKVYTTIISKHQLAAINAVQNNVINYDERHGYRGASEILWKSGESSWGISKILKKLKEISKYMELEPAVVLSVFKNSANILLSNGSQEVITMKGVRWARRFISDEKQGIPPMMINNVIHAGEQIWVRKIKNEWYLSQIPDVNAAFIALNPNNGAITTLVGGFNFNLSKFNRVTQSLRQVGSSIKPFLYAAAIDKGMTLSSLINDAPISRWDSGKNSNWRPKNSPAKYDGLIRLRQGLGQSKNVVMVRMIRAIGIEYASNYLTRFGFPLENINNTESIALGVSSFTPLQLVRAYSVIVNGGYLIDPYYISKIENNKKQVIFKTTPKTICSNYINTQISYDNFEKELLKDKIIDELIKTNDVIYNNKVIDTLKNKKYQNNLKNICAPYVINEQIAFLIKNAMMTNIYGESNWLGTGWRSAKIFMGRRDIGGKTGTTNNSKDAWFSGYAPNIVATAWIGFDDNKRTLGNTHMYGVEVGAKSAQPIWNDFMKTVLIGVPIRKILPPRGIISVSIDDKTGKLGSSLKEYYIEGTEPKDYEIKELELPIFTEDNSDREELF
ncbi:peptidoglycan glycosyltransferase/peptidoglycan DD-transpeptidase MrcA [Candidatus Providencia siddallii]|uniref:Penicillin-binding protein 1A n=1 Tax=Candidatus Providencia siddallii TaxID=1715285 RepID=A0ABM9NPA1_9GAMM